MATLGMCLQSYLIALIDCHMDKHSLVIRKSISSGSGDVGRRKEEVIEPTRLCVFQWTWLLQSTLKTRFLLSSCYWFEQPQKVSWPFMTLLWCKRLLCRGRLQNTMEFTYTFRKNSLIWQGHLHYIFWNNNHSKGLINWFWESKLSINNYLIANSTFLKLLEL